MKQLLFGLLMLLSISSISQAQTIAYEWDAAADTTKLPSTKKFNRAVLKGEAILVTTSALVKGTYFTAGDIIYAKKNRPTLVTDFADILPKDYLEYYAKVTQSGTSAPTIVVYRNELAFPTLTFTRDDVGQYSSSYVNATFDLTKYSLSVSMVNNMHTSLNPIIVTARFLPIVMSNHGFNFIFNEVGTDGTLTPRDIQRSFFISLKKHK